MPQHVYTHVYALACQVEEEALASRVCAIFGGIIDSDGAHSILLVASQI